MSLSPLALTAARPAFLVATFRSAIVATARMVAPLAGVVVVTKTCALPLLLRSCHGRATAAERLIAPLSGLMVGPRSVLVIRDCHGMCSSTWISIEREPVAAPRGNSEAATVPVRNDTLDRRETDS